MKNPFRGAARWGAGLLP
uniref:Uncharacterized protein n=1 Tax=Anguilla anguilla TaxID=7936 RepID=A0A0E9QGC3_ANGAN